MRTASGIIELTSRANVQLRGVRAETHDRLLGALRDLGLLDADPAAEARRNLLVAPLWVAGQETERVARALLARLEALPDLPPKFGFAVDCGVAPVLGAASADIRVERGVSGGLIVRADGCDLGVPVEAEGAVGQAIELARWFAGTNAAGRMARHPDLPSREGVEAPAPAQPMPGPGQSPLGPVHGVAFGQTEARALARLMHESGAVAVRVTPGRCLVLEGGRKVRVEGFLATPDPVLAVDACAGAPFCAAASVATRALARRLAGRVGGGLHVSGCAKGCARARGAGVTLVGRDGVFDLVRDGAAWDAPVETGLAEARLLEMFGVTDAPV